MERCFGTNSFADAIWSVLYLCDTDECQVFGFEGRHIQLQGCEEQKQPLLVGRKLLIQVENFKHFWILILHSTEQEVSSVEDGAEPGCNKHPNIPTLTYSHEIGEVAARFRLEI